MQIIFLDFVGASLSFACTYYFTQAKRIAFPLSILAIIFNTILYWQKGIYAHLLLEALYFFSMFLGWIKWSGNKQNTMQSIRLLSFSQGILLSVFSLLAILLLASGLQYFTDSDIPYWDASTTVLALIAQFLLCFKVIHCWIVWFIVDALVASLQLYKGIPFHSAIHWAYLIMAVVGYYKWRKIYQTELLANS